MDPESEVLDLPVTLRVGVGWHTEVHVEFGAYQYEYASGAEAAEGFGDVILGLRHRFLEQHGRPSVAVLLQTKFPTADEDGGVGSGEFDYAAGVIATQEFEHVASTLYYELGLIGDPGGGSVLEHSIAQVNELAVGRGWGMFGQVATVLAPEEDFESLFLGAGLSLNLTSDLAADLGANLGLTRDAPDVEVFCGFTWAISGNVGHVH